MDGGSLPLAGGEPRSVHLTHAGQGEVGDPVVHAWIRSKDGSEWIIYSESTGEVWKLFRIEVSGTGKLDGKPEQLTTGTGRFTWEVSVAEDGKLVYATQRFTESIYEIPIDSRGQKSGATVQLPLPEGVAYSSPSLSRDGRWMAYHASILGKSNNIVLRDFKTGTDRVLDDKGRDSNFRDEVTTNMTIGEAIIAPDGSKVIFERDCKTARWSGGWIPPLQFHGSSRGWGAGAGLRFLYSARLLIRWIQHSCAEIPEDRSQRTDWMDCHCRSKIQNREGLSQKSCGQPLSCILFMGRSLGSVQETRKRAFPDPCCAGSR